MTLVATKTPHSERDLWRTPQRTFDYLDKKYGPFTLDAAADEENHKCGMWLGPGSLVSEDALLAPWYAFRWDRGHARVFCNPPYSLTSEFIEKAKDEVIGGNVASVTLLVPATTDVRWFHDYVYNASRGRWYDNTRCEFSQGRIRFERPDGSKAGQPTHGSLFVTFGR